MLHFGNVALASVLRFTCHVSSDIKTAQECFELFIIGYGGYAHPYSMMVRVWQVCAPKEMWFALNYVRCTTHHNDH